MINEKLTIDLQVYEGIPLGIRPVLLPTRRQEKELAIKARKKKSLRKRKPYTRKRGTVHPNKKKATRRRQLKNRWAKDPYWCVAYGYGCRKIDRELWDRYIAPLWKQYDPQDLEVKTYRGYGTKEKPITVYTLDVIHKKHGLVYNGNSQHIYDVSSSPIAPSDLQTNTSSL